MPFHDPEWALKISPAEVPRGIGPFDSSRKTLFLFAVPAQTIGASHFGSRLPAKIHAAYSIVPKIRRGTTL